MSSSTRRGLSLFQAKTLPDPMFKISWQCIDLWCWSWSQLMSHVLAWLGLKEARGWSGSVAIVHIFSSNNNTGESRGKPRILLRRYSVVHRSCHNVWNSNSFSFQLLMKSRNLEYNQWNIPNQTLIIDDLSMLSASMGGRGYGLLLPIVSFMNCFLYCGTIFIWLWVHMIW